MIWRRKPPPVKLASCLTGQSVSFVRLTQLTRMFNDGRKTPVYSKMVMRQLDTLAYLRQVSGLRMFCTNYRFFFIAQPISYSVLLSLAARPCLSTAQFAILWSHPPVQPMTPPEWRYRQGSPTKTPLTDQSHSASSHHPQHNNNNSNNNNNNNKNKNSSRAPVHHCVLLPWIG